MWVKAERGGQMRNLNRPCATCVVAEADRWVAQDRKKRTSGAKEFA
jgi:hypothetical protein